MAVPKKRTGHSAQGKRRSNWKAKRPEVTTCPNCGATVLTHTVCTACGTYKGKPVRLKDRVEEAQPAEKKSAKKAAKKTEAVNAEVKETKTEDVKVEEVKAEETVTEVKEEAPAAEEKTGTPAEETSETEEK